MVASASGGGGSSSPPAIAAFAVDDPKEPDLAAIRFTLSKPATVALSYQPPGAIARLIEAAGENPRRLEAGAHRIAWNFALEPGLEPDPTGSFKPGILVFALIRGVLEEARNGENALTLGLGNDAPVVDVTAPVSEVGAVVPIPLHVADSSSDLIAIRVEFDVQGDEELWLPARPGGLEPGAATPDPAITGVSAPDDGADLVFFWDTDSDLRDLERDVRLRFTPIDPVVAGEPAVTDVFAIDNNAEPSVVIDGKALFAHSDRRRGIPISFQVFDEEGDDVQVVFQWRRPGEEFPALPDDPAELTCLLADPALRRAHRICSEYPRIFEGRVVPLADPAQIRLPEIGTTDAATLLVDGIEGRRLEILRPTPLMPANQGWSTNPLRGPIAAVPIADGLNAFVLDEPSQGSWRLIELELATGVVVRSLATGLGTPKAAGLEERTGRVLVASERADAWELQAVAADAIDGVPVLVASRDDATEATPLRGLLSIGSGVCLLTVGSSLLRVDYTDPENPRATAIAHDLEAPWGMARDPLDPRHIFLALSGRADRGVVRFELDTLRWAHLGARGPGQGPPTEPRWPHPRGLAVDQRANRLYALCEVDPGVGRVDLLGLALGKGRISAGSTLSPLYLAQGMIGFDAADLAAGPDGLVLVARPSTMGLLVGGGMEQARTITTYEPRSCTARVERPFAPPLEATQRWRIQGGLHRPRGLPGGQRRTFTWDSTEALPGDAFLRATVFASERGTQDQLSIPFPLAHPLDGEPLESPTGFRTFAAADIDDDGHVDSIGTLAAPSGGDFLALSSTSLGGINAVTIQIEPVDLDLDGWQDLVALREEFVGQTRFLDVVYGAPRGLGAPLRIDLPSGLETPARIAVHEATGDARRDILLLDMTGGLTELWTLEQGANRTFSASVRVLDTSPEAALFGDWNGDGDLDLVVGSAVFVSVGGVLPQQPTQVLAGGVVLAPLDIGDQDGDGDNDLLTFHFDPSRGPTYSAFSWEGSHFGSARVVGASQAPPATARLADLDGDGDLDIWSDDSVLWNDGLDLRSAPVRVFAGVPADLDADGRLDLVGRGGEVVFDAESGFFRFGSSSGLFGQAFDLDGDGMVDLVRTTGCELRIALQHLPGFFSDREIVIEVQGGPCNDTLPSALDADGDGDMDLLWLVGGRLQTVSQLDPGAFAMGPSFPVSFGYAAGDLDQDGDIDLATTTVVDAETAVTAWFQEVGGHLPVEIVREPMSWPFLSIGDVDSDGDDDVMPLGCFFEPLVQLLQVSPGQFMSTELDPPDRFGSHRIECAVVRDLDRDGESDLVLSPLGGSSCSTSFNCYVFSGIRSGAGYEWRRLAPQVSLVAIDDLDRNGTLEVATFPGGIYSQPIPGAFELFSFASSWQPVDVDGDGELDLTGSLLDWNGH